ncbi:MAG: hypothetical protein JJD98_10535 [Polaromonas sp.]|nr:hypothetical protein [Polaromonas sp.]
MGRVLPVDLELAKSVDPLLEQVFVAGENHPLYRLRGGALQLRSSSTPKVWLPGTSRVHNVALERMALQTRDFARYAVRSSTRANSTCRSTASAGATWD